MHTNHVHLNGEEPQGNQWEKGEENGGGWEKKREAHRMEVGEVAGGEGWSHEQGEAERRA